MYHRLRELRMPAVMLRLWQTVNRRGWPWIGLALVLIFCGIVRWRLRDIPLERDEGEFAYAGQLLLEGIPPYQYAYTLKFPGVHAAYALIMAVFGQSAAGIHLGLAVVNAACSVLLFLLGRRLVNVSFGLVAGTTYAVTSLGQRVLGLAGQAEHFVNLFVLSGLLALLVALASGRKGRYLLSGLLFGLAILMKQQALPLVIFACLYLIAQQVQARPIAWRPLLTRLGLLGAGAAIPFAVTCLILGLLGLLPRFWFWTIQYAAQYGREQSLAAGWANFQSIFGEVVRPALPLWLLGGLGLIWLVSRRLLQAEGVFILGLLGSSVLAFSAGLYFRDHYFLLLLPAVGLLVAVAIHRLPYVLQRPDTRGRAVAAGVFVLALAYAVFAQGNFFFYQSAEEACRATYKRNPFIEAVTLARYIKAHCPSDQTIAVLGSEPEIYFYSHRRSATGYIYTYGLMEPQPDASKMQREMAAEIEASRPQYVVYVGNSLSWLVRRESDTWIVLWAAHYCEQMELVAIADNMPTQVVYRWDKEVADHAPHSPCYMALFRRRASP